MRIEELEIGDELVCISPEYFKDKSMDKKVLDYLSVPMKVLVVNKFITLISDDNHFALTVFPKELKYFKKKEEEQEKPSFDDLIDVVIQAYKDNLVSNVFITNFSVEFDNGFDTFDYDRKTLVNGIKYIQSLYKETFVIECEEDIKRIKDNAVVTLLNGHELPAIKARRDEYIEFTGVGDFYFLVLKGATVEQDRNV